MWEKTFYFNLISICGVLAHKAADYDLYHSNGWIPLTDEKVVNQMRRQFIQIPNYNTKDIFKADVIKLVTPQIELQTADHVTEDVQFKHEGNTMKMKCNEHEFSTCLKDFEEENDNAQDTNGFEPVFQMNTNTNENFKAFSRQAKNIPVKVFQGELNLIDRQNKVKRNYNDVNNKQQPDINEKRITVADTKHTYEVTENYNIEDPIKGEQSGIHLPGYRYEPPKLNNNNITNGLFKILSKYNIKSNDELPNYGLSLQKDYNSMKNYNSYQPIFHRKFPYGNSLNHLPVNPLLAVLLSNYGRYLPGWYGISSNYNNLYGYLASNNIHNNRPFGVYKIFSDTDSSI